MKIGLLVTSISNFGQKGYYNSQEIGLAKALSKFAERVEVYKLIPSTCSPSSEIIEHHSNVCIHFCPAFGLGINGFLNTNILDETLSCLIHFADTQLSVPGVYRWSKRHQIQYLPYIGVLESHSTNLIKQLIINLLFHRNLRIYRKCHCFVKTPTVQNRLRDLGVKDITVTPVGLDLSLLKTDYQSHSSTQLKMKYGYRDSDKVLLFIGRFVAEKEPVKMVDLFAGIKGSDAAYKLLMVGSGELEKEVVSKINSLGLNGEVQIIRKIPNNQIWELYRLADCFVNLNQNEIFGMAILEAMYYGCKVIAWKAPGPNYIIEDGVSGMLIECEEQAISAIIEGSSCNSAHDRIVQNFTWDRTANVIINRIREFIEL